MPFRSDSFFHWAHCQDVARAPPDASILRADGLCKIRAYTRRDVALPHQDIAKLRLILHLTRDMGVHLAGVEIILPMQHQLEHVRGEMEPWRQLLADCVQQNGTERVQTQALMKATPRKLVKVK